MVDIFLKLEGARMLAAKAWRKGTKMISRYSHSIGVRITPWG
jgi:hypothetical protein